MKPARAVRLHVEPITLALANEYVSLIHRHHGPVITMGSASFSLAAATDEGEIRGIATAGLPIAANRLRDGWRTLEVMRVATDGTPNACSILYAACARAAKAAGFSRIITYILDSEVGTSVKAAGWTQDEGVFGDLSWQNRPTAQAPTPAPKGAGPSSSPASTARRSDFQSTSKRSANLTRGSRSSTSRSGICLAAA